MSNPYQIRCLNHKNALDVALWKSVRFAALADSPAAFGATLEDARMREGEQWSADLTETSTYVAVGDNDDAIGSIRISPDREDTDWFRITSFWVAPKHRGTSLAGDLMDSAILEAVLVDEFSEPHDRRSGVLLWCGRSNERAAAFYRKSGFVADESWRPAGYPWVVMLRPFTSRRARPRASL